MLLLRELPLHGAARVSEGGGSWGISRCAGLLDYRKKDAASGGSPAARGCSIRDERKRLLLRELPLRGAAQLETKGRGCFWGSCRCAGLLDYRKKDAASGGSPAARGCWITEIKLRLLRELPLRGLLDYRKKDAASAGAPAARAAGLQKERCCFWGISRCAGLLN